MDPEPIDGAAPIIPVGATATSVLAPQTSSCSGERFDYLASNATDGNPGTAWATASDDGVGEVLTVDLGGPMRLSEVGLIPGYAKRGPLKWADCEMQDLFWLNRWVTEVRWTFDDGTSIQQSFRQRPDLQSVPVDVVSTSVRIEILGSELPVGEQVDDDTLISETSFIGTAA